MKLFRFGAPGWEQPGAVDADGQLRDLSLLIDDWTPHWLAPERLQALQAIDLCQLPRVPAGARIGVPVHGIGQFLAIGLNYRQHALEAHMPIPEEPVVFNKALTCLAGAHDDVALPPGSTATDWEVELGIVIGRPTHQVSEAQALSHVAGYVLANDLSERDWQIHHNGQWVKGKSYPGFGPIGPWLVTANEVPDPQAIALTLSVNGM
jgi:2,4-diketo-3-deoxy-L-fuconate hydrolase